jgi:hypothetical protein
LAGQRTRRPISDTIGKSASHGCNRTNSRGFLKKRPIAVTIIAWLLIVAGVFGFTVHIRELLSQKPFHFQDLWIPIVGFLPAAIGVFILLGHNWARWLALAWMAFHVAISFLDSLQKVAVHVLLFVLIAYSLFRRDAKAYFQHPEEIGT